MLLYIVLLVGFVVFGLGPGGEIASYFMPASFGHVIYLSNHQHKIPASIGGSYSEVWPVLLRGVLGRKRSLALGSDSHDPVVQGPKWHLE